MAKQLESAAQHFWNEIKVNMVCTVHNGVKVNCFKTLFGLKKFGSPECIKSAEGHDTVQFWHKFEFLLCLFEIFALRTLRFSYPRQNFPKSNLLE